MNSLLTSRARDGEGVVFTGARDSAVMIRMMLYYRLLADRPGLTEDAFLDFCNGKTDFTAACEIINTIKNYRVIDPAIGQGIFFRTYYELMQSINDLYSINTSLDWMNRNCIGYDIDREMINESQSRLPFKPRLIESDFLLAENIVQADVIIANPPYVRQELIKASVKKELVSRFRQDYPDLNINARSDMYIYFILQSAKLLLPNGIMTFIVPNGWLDNEYGKALRHLFSTGMQLHELQERKEERHFSVDVNTIIVSVQKSEPIDRAKIVIRSDEKHCKISQKDIRSIKLGWYGWLYRCPEWLREVITTNSALVPLGEMLDIRTGIITGDNKQFYSDRKKSGYIPAIRTPREVKRLIFNQQDVKYHVQADSIPYQLRYAPILWPDLRGNRHMVIWNESSLPYEHTFYGLIPRNNKNFRNWTLLLNSTWIWLMVELFGRKNLGGGAIRLVKNDLGRIPLPQIDLSELDTVSDAILQRPISNHDSELTQPDRLELDRIVFNAIGLQNRYEECVTLVSELMHLREVKSRP